jgi:CBS domain-containing protein/ribosome-associated translation inhibitor RaiA
MSSKEMTLNDSFESLQRKSVNNWIESPVVVEPDSTVSRIIGVMIDRNAYDVFVPLAGKIAQINCRDLLSVRDITSTRPSLLGKIVPMLSPEDTVGYAARIMSYYRLRALPIGNKEGELVGQISAKSLVKTIQKFIRDGTVPTAAIRAHDIMTPQPIVLAENDKVSAARSIMERRRIDHLPVVKNNNSELSGIVTSGHIIRMMLPSEKISKRSLGVEKLNRLDMQVSGIADSNVVISSLEDSLQAVVDTIIDADSTYSVVTDDRHPRGIVTYRDIMSLFAEKVAEDVQGYIIGLPEDPTESESVKSKFASTIRHLNAIQQIEEARCKLKLHDAKGARKRYEVDVHIVMPNRSYSYRKTGYDLTRIFDQIGDALKRKIAERPRTRGFYSVRKSVNN